MNNKIELTRLEASELLKDIIDQIRFCDNDNIIINLDNYKFDTFNKRIEKK